MKRMIRRIRAWWWVRQWMIHGQSCRQCAFAAEGFVRAEDVSKCCALGGLTARLAAIYANEARSRSK